MAYWVIATRYYDAPMMVLRKLLVSPDSDG